MACIDEGAEKLVRLKKVIGHARNKKGINISDSKFMAVISCGKFAYTRDDWVKVIPIGCLR